MSLDFSMLSLWFHMEEIRIELFGVVESVGSDSAGEVELDSGY